MSIFNRIASNTRFTSRSAGLAELFADQQLDLENLLAALDADFQSVYSDGHLEWTYDEDLREYKRRVESLLRMAKELGAQHEFASRQ